MKLLIIIIIAIVLTQLANAQGKFIRASIGYGKTGLPNTHDLSKMTSQIQLVNTYKANAGVDVGKYWGKANSLCVGINSGLKYAPIYQNYYKDNGQYSDKFFLGKKNYTTYNCHYW